MDEVLLAIWMGVLVLFTVLMGLVVVVKVTKYVSKKTNK